MINFPRAANPSRGVLFAFALLAVLTVAVAPARAQNFGTLQGHVYDQSGLPLKGVRVTISSPTQIGGARTEVTNDEGRYRFAGLFPGKFRVEASAPKLRKVIQEGVPVAASQPTELDLVMEVETSTEEVQVIQRAPAINQASTRVGESFDADFMSSLPLQTRDYQGVAALAAGVTATDSGNPQVRGGTSFSNRYTVDGFNTTDPVTRTFSQNFSFNAMAAVEVTTAGSGAEGSGTSGGVMNIVTKSGSNRFEFEIDADYTDENLQFFKDQGDQGSNRLATINTYVGGPIKRDVLWYAVSGALVDNTFTLPSDPNFPKHPSLHAYGFDGMTKLTWRPSTRHEVNFLGSVSPGVFNNIIQSPLVEPEAEERFFQRTEFVGLTYQYIGPLYLISRVGYKQQVLETKPQSCEWDPVGCTTTPSETDILTNIRRGNSTEIQLDQRRTFTFSGHGEYVLDTRATGSHGLRLGWEFEALKNDVRQTVPGDFILQNIGPDPFARTEYCSNDPLQDMGNCRRNYLRSAVIGSQFNMHAVDSWKPTRYLTFKLGAAMNYGMSENDRGLEVVNTVAFTPHAAVLWDPTHDGRTKLQATFNGVADTGFLALARFTSRSLYSKRCSWDKDAQAYVQGCRSSGGNDSITVGLPCGPSGVNPDGTSCRTDLTTPRLWEATLGAEREIFTGITLGSTLIYRRFVNQWEDAETNANWNEGGTALNRDGAFKTDRSQFVFDLQTPDAARRVYKGVTTVFRKREGRAKAIASYTLSSYEGPVDSSFASFFLDNPGQTQYFYGPLASDSRHDLRALATYQATTWLSLGVSYLFASGGPYNRFFFDPVTGSFSRFQAPRGYDSQNTLSPHDDEPLRYPDVSQLSLQARVGLEPLIKQRVEGWVDMLNLLSLRTTTQVVTTDGPFFGRSVRRTSPLRLRLGIRYRF